MYKAAMTHPLIIKDLTEFSKRPNLVDYADASAAKERSSGAMKNKPIPSRERDAWNGAPDRPDGSAGL
jgi:hypothetical protein